MYFLPEQMPAENIIDKKFWSLDDISRLWIYLCRWVEIQCERIFVAIFYLIKCFIFHHIYRLLNARFFTLTATLYNDRCAFICERIFAVFCALCAVRGKREQIFDAKPTRAKIGMTLFWFKTLDGQLNFGMRTFILWKTYTGNGRKSIDCRIFKCQRRRTYTDKPWNDTI